MAIPKGYFDRSPTVRTDAEMKALLSERCKLHPDPVAGSADMPLPPAESPTATAAPTLAIPSGSTTSLLSWLPPVRHESGSGSQYSTCGWYVIRKCASDKDWVYWVWYGAPNTHRKLVGHRQTASDAQLCAQEHATARRSVSPSPQPQGSAS